MHNAVIMNISVWFIRKMMKLIMIVRVGPRCDIIKNS